uniref:Uncharacterized protein n=1 Tax=Arundo donax TaxID=35708 RepID=A0A0A9DU83_ARUDO
MVPSDFVVLPDKPKCDCEESLLLLAGGDGGPSAKVLTAATGGTKKMGWALACCNRARKYVGLQKGCAH